MLETNYLQKEVSIYRNARDNKGLDKPFAIQAIISSIKSEKYSERTVRLRTLTDPNENSQYKISSFIGVTWSGIFTPTRATTNLQNHSGMICIDIDKLEPERLQQIRQWLIADVHTFICFISPNGNGLKAVVKIDIEDKPERHKAFFAELERYYKDCYQIDIDKSGKNVDRLCFLPFDPDVYVNPDSEIFCLTEPLPEEVKQPETSYNYAIDIDTEIFDWCVEVQSKKQPFENGNRNRFITVLANFCNQYGVNQQTVLSECSTRFVETDFTEKEIRTTVNNVYQKFLEHDTKIYQKPAFKTDTHKTQDETNTEEAEKEAAPVQTPTISTLIYDALPNILKKGCNAFTTEREQDVFLTGALTVLSGCFPSVTGLYDGVMVRANLYSFIVAPAASGKSAMTWTKQLAVSYHKELVEYSKNQLEAYELQLNDWEQSKRKNKGIASEAKPEPPPFQMLFFPANSSGASVILNLKENAGKGIIFESEADTLSSTLSQDWGNYSDMLRKAFHHEPITYMRKTSKEFYEVEHPRLSVCLSGTPAQVQRLIPTAEDGLFSRFIFYNFRVEPHWRDVSPNGKRINLNEYFEALEKQVFELIKYTVSHSIVVELQNHHWDILNNTFTKWLKEVSLLIHENAVGSIKRLGLITFRIAMILSVLRHFEEGLADNKIICSDTDFDTAMQLADIYKEHAIIMFSQMPEENKKFNNKFAIRSEQLKKAITFEKQGLSNRKIASEIGVSEKTIRDWLKMRSA